MLLFVVTGIPRVGEMVLPCPRCLKRPFAQIFAELISIPRYLVSKYSIFIFFCLHLFPESISPDALDGHALPDRPVGQVMTLGDASYRLVSSQKFRSLNENYHLSTLHCRILLTSTPVPV